VLDLQQATVTVEPLNNRCVTAELLLHDYFYEALLRIAVRVFVHLPVRLSVTQKPLTQQQEDR